jgi:putative transposase
MNYQAIDENRDIGAVVTLCRGLDVSVSGYYAWRRRGPSAHQQRDAELIEHIRAEQKQGRGLYGSDRIYYALRCEQGIVCSRKRIARLMRENGLNSRRRRRWKVRTTDSRHNRPVAPNLLDRDFSATAPNEKWLGDIVGIWTGGGWLYLATILDCFSRMIVGWAMSAHRDEALVEEALRMALQRRQIMPGSDLMHHTDRGSQYTADDYLALLRSRGIVVSMSRKADPYDNAMMESFFATLRAELTELEQFATRAAAQVAVFDYIEVFYNRQRIHTSIGYTHPTAYEACHLP